MSFLNLWKSENIRRNDYMIIFNESYLAELEFEFETPGYAVGRASDCAMEPGKTYHITTTRLSSLEIIVSLNHK